MWIWQGAFIFPTNIHQSSVFKLMVVSVLFQNSSYRAVRCTGTPDGTGPVYDNEKENWRILTTKEIYASVKKPTIIETISLNRLSSFGHVQRMEENRIPKRVLYTNLATTRLRGRPINRWQDEMRDDGRIVGEEAWQEKVYNREEWKNLLRTARNRRILHMPMECMCVCVCVCVCVCAYTCMQMCICGYSFTWHLSHWQQLKLFKNHVYLYN